VTDDWLAGHLPCPSCPHEPYVLHSQRWRMLGPKTHSKGPDPWDLPAFRAEHPNLIGAERALAWLHSTFGAGVTGGR
jgi:hypothetical protein